jgi:hypothetical protein
VLEFTTPTFSFFSAARESTCESCRHDRLLGREVRRGEIDHLFALIGDGDPGDNDVAVAGVQGGEDAFPWGIDQLDIKAFRFGDRFDDIDIKTFQLFLAVFNSNGRFRRNRPRKFAEPRGRCRHRRHQAACFHPLLNHDNSVLCINFA